MIVFHGFAFNNHAFTASLNFDEIVSNQCVYDVFFSSHVSVFTLAPVLCA